MARRIPIPLVLVMVCVLLLAGGVLAADDLSISRSVIGGGGQRVTSTGYILHGTVGEPIASNLSLQTTYGLSSGFWWSQQYRVYLPLVQLD